MSDPTTPEPPKPGRARADYDGWNHSDLVDTILELNELVDLQSAKFNEAWDTTRATIERLEIAVETGRELLAAAARVIERLEGEKAELEATVVRAAHEVDDHIAALLDARVEVERLREVEKAAQRVVGSATTCEGSTFENGTFLYTDIQALSAALEEGKPNG